MFRTTVAVLTLAGAGLLLAGCSSDSNDEAVPASAASSSMSMSMPSMSMPSMSSAPVESASNDIVISGFAFEVPAKVSPGQQITIQNNDTAEHSVTADSGGVFDVDVEGGGTAVFTVPSAAGAYAFHCEYHPKMVATLTVG